MNKVVILGNGLLGKELQRQTEWDLLSREKDGFDITDTTSFELLIDWCDDPHLGRIAGTPKYNTLVNCIAYTETYSNDRAKHWDVNYKAVANLTEFCNKWKIKLVHISTSYVYANSHSHPTEQDVPVHQATYYAYTKLLADGYIELRSNNYLVIRTTHKPKPFLHNQAWINQIGNFDYVDKIAGLIIKVVHKNITGIVNVGTEIKTMYDLARETREDVEPLVVTAALVPTNFIMSIEKLNKLLS